MANQWLRLWHDMPNDPKWRTIARVSGQPIPSVLSVYLHLLVNASCSSERGTVQNVVSEDIASALDIQVEQVDAILAAMQGRVMDGDRLTGWEKRQPKREDDSAERARTWREEKKAQRTQANAGERIETQTNAVERPDKDKEKDSEKEKDLNTPPIVPPTGGNGTRKKSRSSKSEEVNQAIEQELFGTDENPNGIWQLWTPARRGTKSDVLKAYKSVRKESNVAAIRAGAEEYMRSAYVTSRVETQNTTYIKTLAAWLREQRWELAGTGAWDEPCQEWKRIHASEQPGFNYNGPCRVINFAPRDGTLG